MYYRIANTKQKKKLKTNWFLFFWKAIAGYYPWEVPLCASIFLFLGHATHKPCRFSKPTGLYLSLRYKNKKYFPLPSGLGGNTNAKKINALKKCKLQAATILQ